MNTFPHKEHLSEEELKNVLSGKNDAHVKKLLDDCELSRDAIEGYQVVPGAIAELPSLQKKIAARSGMSGASFFMNTIFIAAIAIIIGLPAYFFWPRNNSSSATSPSSTVVQNNIPEKNSPGVAPVLTPQSEHFVNPDAKPVPEIKPVVAKKDSSGKYSAATIDNSDEDIPQLLEQKPVIPSHPEGSYNASVGFIFDLKITEFEKYDHEKIPAKELNFTGVAAAYEDSIAQKEDLKLTEAPREVSAEKFLDEGLLAFYDGHYGLCITKMDVLRKNDPNDLNAAFYSGVSYVKLEMFAKAIPYFDAVLNSPNNVFHEEAKWYKAQALLGLGEKETAKILLGEIVSGNGFYSEKAAGLLKKL
ncbi:MAG: hypothetical protein HY064_09595 [Bacteroidetes bacterium]|nr:hypothetical protein [Bacteroidota bacterium]